MTLGKRISTILTSLLLMLVSGFMVLDSGDAFELIARVLSAYLVFMGLKSLVYYCAMARCMVGGKRILFAGIMLLNFGMFTVKTVDSPTLYIILYLTVVHSFAGLVGILRALEAKKLESSWGRTMSGGIFNAILALVIFIVGVVLGSHTTLVYIYAGGLFYSALARIVFSFRKTAMVYIS